MKLPELVLVIPFRNCKNKSEENAQPNKAPSLGCGLRVASGTGKSGPGQALQLLEWPKASLLLGKEYARTRGTGRPSQPGFPA